jgi:RsiW-degrading membrane proteinase PrsW (M82 family)
VAWANGGLWLLIAGFIALTAYGAAGIGLRTPWWVLVWFLSALILAVLWGFPPLRRRVALVSIAVASVSIWILGSVAATSSDDSIWGLIFGLVLIALVDAILALLSAA